MTRLEWSRPLLESAPKSRPFNRLVRFVKTRRAGHPSGKRLRNRDLAAFSPSRNSSCAAAISSVYLGGPANQPLSCSIQTGYFDQGPDPRPDEKGIETILDMVSGREFSIESPDPRPDEKGIET